MFSLVELVSSRVNKGPRFKKQGAGTGKRAQQLRELNSFVAGPDSAPSTNTVVYHHRNSSSRGKCTTPPLGSAGTRHTGNAKTDRQTKHCTHHHVCLSVSAHISMSVCICTHLHVCLHLHTSPCLSASAHITMSISAHIRALAVRIFQITEMIFGGFPVVPLTW